jgi:hypothetical protein
VAGRKYGEEQMLAGFWWGNQKEKDHLIHTGTDGRIIFPW